MTSLPGYSETSLAELVASFQAYNYVYVAIATFWTYDYCITFDQELSYLWYALGRKVKVWYMLTKSLPFALLGLHLFLDSLPPGNASTCILLDDIATLISILIILFSDVLFAIRTWALWNRRRIVVFSMLALAVPGFAITIFVTIFMPGSGYQYLDVTSKTSASGCFHEKPGAQMVIPFAFSIACQTQMLILTLIRVFRSYRETGARLFKVLVQHSVLYVFCSITFSVVNILGLLLAPDAYGLMFQDLQIVLQCTLATRMQRSLWIAGDKPARDPRFRHETHHMAMSMNFRWPTGFLSADMDETIECRQPDKSIP